MMQQVLLALCSLLMADGLQIKLISSSNIICVFDE